MKLNDKTTVPISAVWTAGIGLVGFVMWLTTIFVQGNANAKDLENLKTDMKVLIEIRERVIRIEERLEKASNTK